MSRDLGIPVTETDDYYFISYNTEDADRISSIVKQLHSYGFPMWYDKGLQVGKEWEKTINKKIRHCNKFILFLTRGIFEKEDPYVPKEYKKAKEYFSKDIIIIALDEIKKTDVTDDLIDWHMEIQKLQNIQAYNFPKEDLTKEIMNAVDFPISKSKDVKSSVTEITEKEIRLSQSSPDEGPRKIEKRIRKVTVILICFVLLVIALIAVYHYRKTSSTSKLTDEKEKIKDLALSTIKENTALVIIAGKHANAYEFSDLMIDEAEKKISSAIDIWVSDNEYHVQANISIVVNDGHPEPESLDDSLTEQVDFESEDEASSYKEKLISEYLAFLTQNSLKATEPETDLLASLTVARRLLNSDEDNYKRILILDTGFSTHGGFNMITNSIMDGTVEDVIERISDGSIPALDEIELSFYGLGTVGEEQATMSNTFSDRLVAVWNAIITSTNANLANTLVYSSGQGTEMYYSEDDPDSYPLVTVIPTPNYDNEKTSLSLIDFPNSALNFKSNSAEFINKEEAQIIIGQYTDLISDYLEQNPDDSIYVVGSIAKTTPDMNETHDAISEARAEAVADILVNNYGIASSRITVIDGGTTEFSWRNSNEFPDGDEADPQAQQKNRKVVIFGDCDQDLVNELREKSYLDD